MPGPQRAKAVADAAGAGYRVMHGRGQAKMELDVSLARKCAPEGFEQTFHPLPLLPFADGEKAEGTLCNISPPLARVEQRDVDAFGHDIDRRDSARQVVPHQRGTER